MLRNVKKIFHDGEYHKSEVLKYKTTKLANENQYFCIEILRTEEAT